MAPGKLVHLVPRDLVARDQELSGIELCISIASKTAAIAYRSSIGSTKPHARIALEMSSLSSVFGNSSNPATDSSSSYRRSSNRATLSSVMRTFKSAKAWLTSGVGHMRSVEGSRNSLFILSIGASLPCARMNAAGIAFVHVGFACRKSRIMGQRTKLHSGFTDLPTSGCRGPDTARTSSRHWSVPLGRRSYQSAVRRFFRSETCREDPGENGDHGAQACGPSSARALER
jgi:hypothetical protein